VLQNILDTGSVGLLITDGAQVVTTLEVVIQGTDLTTGEFATFTHKWSYIKNAGVISAGVGVQPAAVDLNHSAAAVGILPQFAINGARIVLNVTPWSSDVQWAIQLQETVNIGTF
jgi:hypothetical protein